MVDVYLTLALSLLMGFSIFFSAPIIFRKKTEPKHILLLNAVAIGILVFLLLDIFADVAEIFPDGFINLYELIFIIAFALAFLFFILPKKNREPHKNPKRTSLLAAAGIGFQNLTEGLVFGSAGAAGLFSLYVVSLIGFTLQNMTEGFPIAAPLLNLKKKVSKKFLIGAFLIGGIPVVIGTIIGLYFYSQLFIIFFDALASAAILYVVLVLFHVNLDRSFKEKERSGYNSVMWLTYAGVLLGFVLAFLVNYI